MVDYQLHKNDLPAGLNFGQQIGIDCEMMGLNIDRDRLAVVQLYDQASNKVHIVQFPDRCDAPNLKKLLCDDTKLFIGHMIRLDMGWLLKYLECELNNVYCTRTASRIARTYSSSHDFKDLVTNILGKKIDKSETSSDWGSETLTSAQIQYVCDDVIYLPELKDALDKILTRENRMGLMTDIMKTLTSRVRMDVSGWWGEDILGFPF